MYTLSGDFLRLSDKQTDNLDINPAADRAITSSPHLCDRKDGHRDSGLSGSIPAVHRATRYAAP